MSEQIETIKRCYEALEYEINKQKALKTICNLHYKLKFRDINNFSDRFLQTASLIEQNLSVFKSACDHVDIVTTILDFLHTVGVKLMFNHEFTDDEIIIIYLMYIVCEEQEIPTFLKAALINNSQLEHKYLFYITPSVLNRVYEMIVLEDSDLYAVISYLKITPSFLSKIRKIYIQESIKQKFIWLLEKHFQDKNTYNLNLLISIFRTKKELLRFCSYLDILASVNMVSIWSEDITSAKVLATTLRRDITFINAHFEFCSNITISWKTLPSIFNMFDQIPINWYNFKDDDKINPNEYIGSVNDLFYNGVWQKPVKNGYWIHNSKAYAYATTVDILRCKKSAEEASENWSLLPIVSRRKILENLAFTFECNGKFLLARTILDTIALLNIYNYNNLECHQNERLEIIRFHGSKGVVSVYDRDEVVLLRYLTLSLILGNCVIVVHNKNSCTLAPYFNMFSTAEVPPGVVNLLSSRNILNLLSIQDYNLGNIVKFCTSINHVILPLK